MKISFNTLTVSHGDLVMLEHIISRLLHDNDGPGEEDGPWAEGYAERSSIGKFTATLTGNTGTKESDEFEPDENDFDVDAPVVLTNNGDNIITVSDAVVEPGKSITIDQVLPLRGTSPEYASLSPDENGNKPVVPPPSSPVIPPPPPQVAAEVSSGSNEGVSDDLDSDGVMWDATVHSESRAKNVDGTWRKRRNTKNVEVKAAIKGLESITPNSVPAPPAERKMVRTFVRIDGGQNLIAAPENATDEELSVITGKPTMREDRYLAVTAEPVVPAPPPVPAAPPPPPSVVKTAAPGAPAGTFNELMERVTKHFAAQKITSVDLAEICKTFNIGSMQECFTQTHLIPLVSNAVDQKAASK